ncbi:MAG: helix-turn-helix transcriptional regulator, partial [Clostridia bacterium]|nr:helix-turn-helix transcriptional regulator [Clostridia bacterium]
MKLDLEMIGKFIQSCRKEVGLTQAEVGERLGVSAQSVSNWERGETLPDVSVLPDLACMLRCSVDAILSGGSGCGGYRRHVTVEQMREALGALNRIGELLGRDHFIYTTIIEALNTRMNTTIEQAF